MATSRASHALSIWLADHDKNQADLAAALTAHTRAAPSVNQSTVSAWVRGRSTPSGGALIALRAVAGIELEWWLEPAPDPDATGPLSAASSSGTIATADTDRPDAPPVAEAAKPSGTAA